MPPTLDRFETPANVFPAPRKVAIENIMRPVDSQETGVPADFGQTSSSGEQSREYFLLVEPCILTVGFV